MKMPFIMLISLVLPIASSAQTVSQQQQTRDEIRAQVRTLVTATNYDVMATLPLYVPTSRVTSINDAQIVRGWSGLRRQTEAAVPSQGSLFIRTGEVDVTVMGPDHALAFAPLTMEYQTASGPVRLPGSMTLAYERTAGGWKIVHEHYSTGLNDEALASMAEQASTGGEGLLGFLRLLLAGFTGDAFGVASELLNQLGGITCPR
jgi:ketosteroid isomerase-like protein